MLSRPFYFCLLSTFYYQVHVAFVPGKFLYPYHHFLIFPLVNTWDNLVYNFLTVHLHSGFHHLQFLMVCIYTLTLQKGHLYVQYISDILCSTTWFMSITCPVTRTYHVLLLISLSPYMYIYVLHIELWAILLPLVT